MARVAVKRIKREPFQESAIVAQKFPPNPLVGKGEHFYARRTKDGDLYSKKADKIRAKLLNLAVDKRKRATIMAFCKNYYIKHGDLPSMESLQKIFGLTG